MSKFSKKSFLSMSPVDIGKLKVKEARDILRKARFLFSSQEKMFSKYESTVHSPSFEKMEDYYEASGKPYVSKMNLSKLRNEIFRLQDFFSSKTSTVPGARKAMYEQDVRIFGINEKTGKPNKRMTLSQRTAFWSAYNEFINMEKESYIRNMGSNTVQSYLGEMIIADSKKNKGEFAFDPSTFEELKRRLEGEKNYEEWEMSNYEERDNEILSGKWPH